MSSSENAQNAARAGSFRSCAATHEGSTGKHNEDAYLNRPDLGLWAVADGAGGHQAGEVASADCSPVPDGRGPVDYKRHLAGVLTRRALVRASARALKQET